MIFTAVIYLLATINNNMYLKKLKKNLTREREREREWVFTYYNKTLLYCNKTY